LNTFLFEGVILLSHLELTCETVKEEVKLNLKNSATLQREPSQLPSLFGHIKFVSLHKSWFPTVSAKHYILLYLSLNKTNSVIDFGAA